MEQRKLRGKTETVYHFFFFFFREREERERDKQERESVCKEDKGGREGS